RVRGLWPGGDDVARLVVAELGAGERRVTGDLGELGNQARLFGAGEHAAVEVDRRRDPVQERPADRSLVVFDQVEIARRNPDASCQPRLRQRKLLPTFANSLSDGCPRHGLDPPRSMTVFTGLLGDGSTFLQEWPEKSVSY